VVLDGLSFFGGELAFGGHFWAVVSGEWDSSGGWVFEKADRAFWKMMIVPDR
jgi:hypothetical protein